MFIQKRTERRKVTDEINGNNSRNFNKNTKNTKEQKIRNDGLTKNKETVFLNQEQILFIAKTFI